MITMSLEFRQLNSISKLCRICVKQSQTLRYISDSDISEKLQICSNISILKEEGVPDKICYSCELLVQATYRFRNLCKTAAEKLRSYGLKSSLTSFISDTHKKRKKNKECSMKRYLNYAIPEYVEVKPNTEQFLLNDAVPDPNIVKSIFNNQSYGCTDLQMHMDKLNNIQVKNHSEPVGILLNDFESETIKSETKCMDILNSEDEIDNMLIYDHIESGCNNDNSDSSYKPERKTKKKSKVKEKCEIRKQSRNIKKKNYTDDEDSTNLQILRKERKSKTTPPKSKRTIFVAKIVPTKRVRQESNSAPLNKEELSELKSKSLQCFLCGEILENTTKLRKHLLFHERNKYKSMYNSLELDPNEKVLCEVCGLALENSSALQVHFMLHSEKFPYHCKLCPHRTRQAISLKIHMRKHTGEKPYACPHCRNIFSTSSNRLKHIRTKHITGPERPFQCEICKRHCSSKVTLENHLNAIHYKVKKHYCEHCNSGFYSRKRMLCHRRKVHNVSAEVQGRTPSYIQKEREKSQNKLIDL